jgi:CRISPR/Cas system Type II protein with McrA/HNH and RuvC-like nuclease domain
MLPSPISAALADDRGRTIAKDARVARTRRDGTPRRRRRILLLDRRLDAPVRPGTTRPLGG